MSRYNMLKDEYIYQEIQEQLRLIKIHQNAPKISIPDVKGKIIITGAGDSYCASEFGEWILKDKYNVIALPAMDALQYSSISCRGGVSPPNYRGRGDRAPPIS